MKKCGTVGLVVFGMMVWACYIPRFDPSSLMDDITIEISQDKLKLRPMLDNDNFYLDMATITITLPIAMETSTSVNWDVYPPNIVDFEVSPPNHILAGQRITTVRIVAIYEGKATITITLNGIEQYPPIEVTVSEAEAGGY